jgi:hypothetical protein
MLSAAPTVALGASALAGGAAAPRACGLAVAAPLRAQQARAQALLLHSEPSRRPAGLRVHPRACAGCTDRMRAAPCSCTRSTAPALTAHARATWHQAQLRGQGITAQTRPRRAHARRAGARATYTEDRASVKDAAESEARARALVRHACALCAVAPLARLLAPLMRSLTGACTPRTGRRTLRAWAAARTG